MKNLLEGPMPGVVPPLALMQILRCEHVDDLHVLAGAKRETLQACEVMDTATLRRTHERFGFG